ncbi:MAG: NAD-dependent epimerase/dehydratase family protein, partial [Candidatus Omnitrophica bacterium]|nr:NAD-dependent epimerase/dehydratase family protein [Candidatus Omnitrophota bacterium]
MPKTSFKNKTLLITGSQGFLGFHLVEELRKAGYRRLALPSIKQYDLTRPERIRAMLKKLRPAAVIHLAARVGGIGANRKNPGLFL